jgi:hypothetical protein
MYLLLAVITQIDCYNTLPSTGTKLVTEQTIVSPSPLTSLTRYC